MFARLKEPSTFAGIGIAGLTYLQQTGDIKGALVAAIGAFFAIFVPETKKK